jgi:hypothetical protein
MVISGKKIKQKWFLFDGCHKFYLIDSGKLTKEMEECGYTQDDIFPIDSLPYEFYNSCPLRFIETWKDYKAYVPQFRRVVTFKGFGSRNWTAQMDFQTGKVETDEPAAHFPGCSYITYKRFV